ncbi:carboxypeptidase-like regulatory domain-containing protein [Olivibacter sitiensis]|uniref:carboxypeptidase-like regulatory domain-containing protein n=1 Tax=Olivibacter sitiensis TaxID=376470 RepID=UPI000425C9CD|nr:carboxypeptidase-like regulatory domain-containing protein [Olivibacter sitiensis]
MKSLYLTLVALSLMHLSTFAQQKRLSGQLKDTTGKPVAHASVMLKNAQGRIIGFNNSNAEGRYAIALPDTARLSSLSIEINHLGYARVQQRLTEGRYAYDITMEEKAIDLSEVQVKSRPRIESRGDTLSYDVESFAQAEDRSIGDVIRRMPGVEVAESGQISYNGRTISNLYIHGDDLMDGRYGLATKAITKDMIKSVDIMQHHQPIKVLQNKTYTDNVAMNLVLKDENSLKLSGQAMLGGGLPEQYDAALNTMLFNKKFKMLNSAKANNSGVDYRGDFEQFGLSGFLSGVGNTRPGALLSAGTAGNPDLPRRNYYLNNSGVINANNLVNTKGGLQLKSNIQGFLDRNTLNYTSRVDNYLAGDTIRYDELQRAVRKPFQVNTSLTAMANKESYFLNDKLSLNFSGEGNSSYMDFNGEAFDQRLRERTRDISNDLAFTPALKNRDIVDLRWYANYYNSPQRLYVGSGLNADILNGGLPYAAISQYAETPTFFSNASAAYRITRHLIKQSYQLGVMNERQRLNSDLDLAQPDGTVTDYAGDVGNALRWARDRAYLNASYELKKGKWEANLSLPLIAQRIRYSQDEYGLDERKDQFFLNPNARLKYFLNAEDYLQANYMYSNNVGNISGVYRGTVLTNYRSLRANDAELQETNTSGTGLYYNFQRSITMLFANAGINYSRVSVNSILASELTDNVQRTVLLPYQNDQSTLSANAGISKYLFGLGTTASLKSSWGRTRYNQFINGQMLPFNNDALSATLGLESKFFGSVSLSYSGTGTWNTSRQLSTDGSPGNALDNRMRRLDQNASLGYSPARGLFLTARARHIQATQANAADISYLFTDANVRYKVSKWRTDLELDLTNLANVRDYEVFSLSSNRFSVNRYEIRGRMAILRATFNL